MSFEYGIWFVGGIVASVLIVLVFGFFWSETYETVNDIQELNEYYVVTIDGVSFICEKEPKQRNSGIRLVDCHGFVGVPVLIENVNSYSVELIK